MLNFKELPHKVIRKACRVFKHFITIKQEASFIRHNKKTWRKFQSDKAEGEILLEATLTASSIISFSYLANLLAKKITQK